MQPVSLLLGPVLGDAGCHTTPSRQPVDSSAALAVRYNAKRRWLDVEYANGGQYRYFGVPADVHQELLATASIGTYLNQYIKPDYRYVRLSLTRA